MTAGAGKPGVWATLVAAFGDAYLAVRQAPGLTAVTTAIAFAEAYLYEIAAARLDEGIETALLSVTDTVAASFILAPLAVATYRYVLLGERPRITGLFGKAQIVVTFAIVSAVVGSAVYAPLALTEGVDPEIGPGRFWSAVAAFLVLAVLSMRLLFLQPMIATRSVLATLRASWRMTRDVYLRLLAALVALGVPALVIVIVLVTLETDEAPHAMAAATTFANLVSALIGSAVVARYYAWRRTQA